MVFPPDGIENSFHTEKRKKTAEYFRKMKKFTKKFRTGHFLCRF